MRPINVQIFDLSLFKLFYVYFYCNIFYTTIKSVFTTFKNLGVPCCLIGITGFNLSDIVKETNWYENIPKFFKIWLRSDTERTNNSLQNMDYNSCSEICKTY